MLIPIRCFTCGSLIGDKEEEFDRRVKAGEDAGKVLDSLAVKRYCCRRMILGKSSTIDHVLPYYEALARRNAEFGGERL